MNKIESIEQKITRLPPNLIIKLENYLDHLLFQKKEGSSSKILKQDWAGGLKDLKGKYSSMKLQKLSLEWRIK